MPALPSWLTNPLWIQLGVFAWLKQIAMESRGSARPRIRTRDSARAPYGHNNPLLHPNSVLRYSRRTCARSAAPWKNSTVSGRRR